MALKSMNNEGIKHKNFYVKIIVKDKVSKVTYQALLSISFQTGWQLL